MHAMQAVPAPRDRVLWADVGLAGVAALAYLLIGGGILAVGDLQPADAPSAIIYLCAGSYLLGGLLILLRRRALWIAGAAINALVLLIFFSAYAARPAVLFSPGGLLTKAAQVLLEVGLLYLIVTYVPGAPGPRREAALRRPAGPPGQIAVRRQAR
jgi:hypothetical protein